MTNSQSLRSILASNVRRPTSDPRKCPALLIAAPASGQGKTTVVAALARHHSRQGRRVRVLKTGPDFLDPMIHRRACGSAVYPLDLWMVGDELCRQLLYDAAGEADLILVEGVMGLYDGTPSSADLARRFGLPVAAVIDAGAMAQTFGALALGLASYEPSLKFAGVFANRVASERHRDMLRDSLPAGLPWLGSLPKNADIALPEADSLYLPGGYPELHLDRLSDNGAMLAAVRDHHRAGKPIVAECGGMLYLLDALATADGHHRALAGLIPASATMGTRLGGLGLQGLAFPEGVLRGHTFHYSTFERAPDFAYTATGHPSGRSGEGVIQRGGLTASYLHWYLPSNPQVAAALFRGESP